MSRVFTFFCLLTLVIPGWVHGQVQLVGNSEGLYCRIQLVEQEQVENKLQLNFRAEWLNERLEPIEDTVNYVVLERENFVYDFTDFVRCPAFESSSYIYFNDTYLLTLLVDPGILPSKLAMKFRFRLAERSRVERGQPVPDGKEILEVSDPAVMLANYSMKEVPELTVAQGNIRPATGAFEARNDRYFALVIGINEYDSPGISSLDNPIRDAEMFYEVITSRYTFNPGDVQLLKNATMEEIIQTLDYFSRVVTEDDNFLIFYAGHGIWKEEVEIGYWLPSDASMSSTVNWFRNSTLRDYLREIQSKHTLVISDACFAGSIFKTRGAFHDAPVAITKLYEMVSRKAMTSGTLTEVPDRSAFLQYLVLNLERNNDKFLSSEQLFAEFRLAVINNSRVVPQYGVIQDVGDEGGEFIFVLRDPE